MSIFRVIIPVLAATVGAAEMAYAEKTDWQVNAQGQAAQACYSRGDWPCAYNGLMTAYEQTVADGNHCDQDEIHVVDEACGFAILPLYNLLVKASMNAVPQTRRDAGQRYLAFLDAYGAPEGELLLDGLKIGAGAMVLDACLAINDGGCVKESATTVATLAAAKSAADLDRMIQIAVTDDYSLDLRQLIDTAQGKMEGIQP